MSHLLSQDNTSFEERLFPLFEQAGVGFAKVGLDCRWLRVNQKLCEMTGYSEEELLSLTFCDITHPEDLEADLTNMKAVMAGELPINVMEKRYFRKDGSIVWIHLTATLVRDDNGQPDYFITIIEDITARKEIETRHQLVLRGSNDGVWDWNLLTDEVYWSDRFYEIIGLSRDTQPPDTALGWELMHPEDRQMVKDEVQKHLKSGSKYELQFRVRHSSGEYRYVLSRAEAICDEQGTPIRMAGVYTDMTDRVKAELALKESEERFRSMADSAPVLIYVSDRQGTTYVNKTCLAFFGVGLEQVTGMNWQAFIHPDDIGPFYQYCREAGQRLEEFQTEVRARRYDGEYRWLMVTGAPRLLSDGALAGYTGVAIDITERKQAEDALKESEQRFRAFADQAPILIAMSDRDTDLIYFNKAWLDYTGRTLEEELAFGWLNGVHPDDREHILQVYLEAHQRQAGFEVEYRLRRHDGEYRWMYSRVAPRFTPGGEFAGYIGSVVDIQDRKQAELAVRESEARFRSMADAAPILIWTCDAQGARDYFNTTWLTFTGRRLADELGDGWVDGLHPEERDAYLETYHSAIRQGLELNAEFRMRCADGQYRWMLDTARPRFGPNGNLAGYVGSVMDITDMKQAQEELKDYAQRLEQSNKELEQFATVASHDLQEPLRKVMIFSQYLQQAQDCQLTPETHDYLARMQNATERMQRLITDLLDLSRINRKGQPFRRTKMNRVVAEALSDLSFAVQDTQGTVEVDDLPEIEADAKQMGQLFRNLIGNALKFHRKGVPPVVRVSARIVDGDTCRIEVQDNGIGFDERYLDRIFGVFERLHGRSEYAGTGIGLAICQKIVQRHHGNITARSTPGQGSTFIITLPVSQRLSGSRAWTGRGVY